MIGHSRRIGRWFCYGLTGLLALPPNAAAQAPASQTPPANPPITTQSLKVIPLVGNQGLNDLERKVMSPLVIQVVDQNDQPVEGATVVFRFPLEGPSALFPDQKNAQTSRTNADGQAAASGWMANGKLGTFQVQVSASRDNELGATTVSMTNVTRIVGQGQGQKVDTHKSFWSSKWTKIGIAVIAAGIATSIVLVTRGSGSKTTTISGPPVITATPGSPTIGGPQ